MAVKFQLPTKGLLVKLVTSPWGRALLIILTLLITATVGTFTFFYVRYSHVIEDKLRHGPFGNTSMLYASPQPLSVGDAATVPELASYLHDAGYSEISTNRVGWYHTRPDAIEVNPGAEAYSEEGAVIKIDGGKVSQIISTRDHTARNVYSLEPQLITNLFDQKREKRRLVQFNDIPKVMVNAVLSAEDKHFFSHAGFDPIGIARAIVVDIKDRRSSQGASTLTQQLARTLWLGPERGWRRKVPETLITLHLEQQLTKQQIFEDYANAIYLGHQGSFSIHGFGEAAEVYLGKDLAQVTPADAALLAGLIQSPIGRNPFRFPDRARTRRNIVLKAMRENGYLTEDEYQSAASSPLNVVRESSESSDAPYFVDLVNDTLQNKFSYDFQNKSYRVFTTLDINLQRDAVEAVKIGIDETDKQWAHRAKDYGTDKFPLAQVALVALDAETGEVKALVGGRSYGTSQLDHALAKRQPGSSFKPFVYATAFGEALEEGGKIITPATTVTDEPTQFFYDDKIYEPADFGDKYAGMVTLRQALAHSMNVPTVKIAEMVGYDKVAKTARNVGLNLAIKPTPSIALGSYEVQPLEIAGAYTVFPNQGILLKPSFIKSIRDQGGSSVFQNSIVKKDAMDPRVAYIMVNMLQEVLRSGTAAGVRGRGFTLPAGGKTGTSRDGWFAGFTSKLICVVWVGFDDNRDFKLEGAKSALPIWTEFMKRAHQHREYRAVHEFEAPDGVVTADVDSETGLLATPGCPKVHSEVFIAGTQPVEACKLHGGGGNTQIAGWEPTASPAAAQPVTVAVADPAKPAKPRKPRSIPITPEPAQQEPAESKSFWQRIGGLFHK